MRSVLLLGVLATGQLLIVLDATVVTVVLSALRADLGFRGADLHWTITGYALAFGGLLIAGGRLADRWGARAVFATGLLGFAAGSALAAAAGSPGALVAGRVVQGAASALIAPSALSFLLAGFPEGSGRTRALGVWAAVSAGGGALGLVLGGVVAHAGSWRWAFWLNLPLCAAAVALACVLLPAPPVRRVGFDVAGAVLATAGVVGLVFAAVRGSLWWAACAVGLLTAFVLVEQRTRAPLLPLRLLRIRPLAGANAVALLLGMSIYAVFYFVSVFLAEQRGFSTIEVGLAFLPMTATTVAGSRIAGTTLGRARPRVVLAAALGIAALGFLPLAAADAYATTVLPALALVGLGLGAAYVILPAAAVDTAAADDRGVAAGLFSTSQQLGGAAGLVALAGTAGDLAAVSVVGATAMLVALLAAVGTISSAHRGRTDACPTSSPRPR